MKPHIILSLTAVILTASCASATVILNDNFSDGNHTNQNLPSSGAWYYAFGTSGTTTLSTNGTRQNLLLDAPASNNTQVWTTFGNTTLSVGQTLSVTFDFDASQGVAGTGAGALRVGFFNIGTPVAANQANSIAHTNWSAATGYAAFSHFFANTSDTGSTVFAGDFKQRTAAGANNTLWAEAAHNGVMGSTTRTGNFIQASATNLTSADLRYFVTFSLTRTDTGIDLFFSMADENGVLQTYTATDTSGLDTSFNTFSVFTGSPAGQDFAIDNVLITVIPEPSSLLALFLTPVLLGFRRRH